MDLIISLIKRDYLFTFKSLMKRNIIFLSIFFIINILMVMNYKSIDKNNINLFYVILKAVRKFGGENGEGFPLIWFLINFFVIFNLGDNFYNDLSKSGKYILIRSGDFKKFYSVKIFLLIANTIIFYVLLFAIMMFFSNVSLSMSETSFIEKIKINNNELVCALFLLYTTTSILLVLIQNIITLIIKPKYACIINIGLLMLSLIIVSDILPGQHNLILRHIPFDNVINLTIAKSVIYNCTLSIGTIIGGYFIFIKKDIY